MSNPNKKYKNWKYNSNPIPRSTYERWERQNLTNKISVSQPEDEMPSCSKKSDVTSFKRQYKCWVTNPSFSIPESTSKRWEPKNNNEVDNCLNVDEFYGNLVEDENITEHNNFNLYDKESEQNDDDGIDHGDCDEYDHDTSCDNESDDVEDDDEDDNDQNEDDNEEDDDHEENEDDEEEDDDDEEDDDEDNDNIEEDNNDTDEDCNSERRFINLYDNSSISINQAVIKIADLWIENKLTKCYLKQHLNFLNEILPQGNILPKTPHRFFRYIKNQVPLIPIIRHYFCENCFIYLSCNEQNCKNCNADTISYFFELDFEEQIRQLFEIKQLHKKLKTISQDKEFISDITDGSEYIRVNNYENRGLYDLTLILYTDGLSLVKSEKSHCWPLMFTIAELPPSVRHLYIVTLGIWCDSKFKPPMNLFLQPFCMKLRKCYKDGIEWTDPSSGAKIISKIMAPLFIADAPARAQIQNVLNFNGKYGCNLCVVKTKQCAKPGAKKLIRIYPFQNVIKLRLGNTMKVQADAINVIEGVKGHSIISMIPKLDVSTCVLPEYMHSVLLGVVKQFINIWINKKGPWTLKNHLDQIDDFLLNIKPIKAFARLPRLLSKFHNYKATEFFNFLLFYSLPTLNNYLPDNYFQHWMLLVTSIFKLLKERIHIVNDLDKAEYLLREFVRNIKQLYGEHELTYNVHQLLHLGLSVRRWGPLWATSAFIFENENGVLARNVHGNSNQGQELLNKLQMMQAVNALKYKTNYEPEVGKYYKFKTLSKANNKAFTEEESQIFCSLNFKVEDLHIFSRVEINKKLYTSLSYKVIKNNNYTVSLMTDDSQYYGSIRYFFMKDNSPYLVLQQFQIDENNYFLNHKTQSVVESILPIVELNNYLIFKIENLESITHVIRVGSFICLKPNNYNVVF